MLKSEVVHAVGLLGTRWAVKLRGPAEEPLGAGQGLPSSGLCPRSCAPGFLGGCVEGTLFT